MQCATFGGWLFPGSTSPWRLPLAGGRELALTPALGTRRAAGPRPERVRVCVLGDQAQSCCNPHVQMFTWTAASGPGDERSGVSRWVGRSCRLML